MDKILNRICSIKKHPISELDEKFRITYLKGLGAFLNAISEDSAVTKMFFTAWAQSILQNNTDVSEFWESDLKAIRKAVSIQRKRFNFFSMKHSFFFDAFYLTYNFEKDKLTTIYNFLNKEIASYFTRGALQKVYDYYVDNKEPSKVSSILIDHKKRNELYFTASPKRVLVIANVSAGKSTLINALVGYPLNKVRTTACTNKLVMLHNKRETDGITISKNTNDCYRYNYYNSIEQVDSNMFVEAAFPFNSSLSSKSICFIDTPGVNNVEDTYHRTITEETIRRNDYNAVIYVSNAQYFGTTDERALLEYLYENVRKPIVFVLNQLDKFKQKEDSIDKMLVDYDNLLNSIGFKQPVIIPVSAQAALLFKIDNTKLDEDELFEKELLQKKFEKDYYNLPQYIGAEISTALLERTGILQLERTIIN
ncbi:dynamin family protein [Capnocytophaga leadbetteri]|jgi:hypothetical protein|uniref:dynamin family protein n=1 Tax=Capnocytophaga leadbetteri TaxID=327575 RepID=UPI0028E2698B|nr:dynamin family protein [Capnocytophaga leadbetteri]